MLIEKKMDIFLNSLKTFIEKCINEDRRENILKFEIFDLIFKFW